MNRIAICLPRDIPFYRRLAVDMAQGFQELGLQVRTSLTHPRGEALQRLCDEFKPDALLEMNRSRDMVSGLPRELPHVCWLADSVAHQSLQFTGSELLYMFHPLLRSPRSGPDMAHVQWLPPGFNPRDFFLEESDFTVDVSFVGHMSLPWSRQELDRVLHTDRQGNVLRFQAVAQKFPEELERWDTTGWSLGDFWDRTMEMLTGMTGEPLELEPSVQYDLALRLHRIARRRKMVDCVLAMSPTPSLEFYGTEGWRHWPEYAPYYRGYLEDPAALRRLYRCSRINLHGGVPGVHFRSLECLASGGVLFFLETPEDDGPCGIDTMFQPGEHYVSYNPENFAEKAARILENPDLGRRIGAAAAHAVHQNHTWRHWAEKIHNDLLGIVSSQRRE